MFGRISDEQRVARCYIVMRSGVEGILGSRSSLEDANQFSNYIRPIG